MEYDNPSSFSSSMVGVPSLTSSSPLTPRKQRGWLLSLATYDCFPNASARIRRFLYHPLGVLLLAVLASLLCGLFLHAQGFLLAGSLLAIVVFGILWPCLSLHGLAAP